MAERPPIQKFPQVDHDQATGELAAVFEDIHGTLRLPWVAFAIRVMSQFPRFVPAAWEALKPNIATRYAERGADAIRQAALLPGPPPPDPTPRLRAAGWSDEKLAELHLALDALNYGNPKYLVLIAAWNEAWNGRDAGGRGPGPRGPDATILPYGLPDGVSKFALVDPDTATPEQQGLLHRARDTLLHHGPASDFRVLVRWPDYLGPAIEEALAPVALGSAYEETARRLRAIAREHVQGFATPGGVAWRELGDALSPPEVAGLTGLLYLYNRFIAEITIAVIRLKQGLSGDASAVENKFPALPG